jgi:hypothetical protein
MRGCFSCRSRSLFLATYFTTIVLPGYRCSAPPRISFWNTGSGDKFDLDALFSIVSGSQQTAGSNDAQDVQPYPIFQPMDSGHEVSGNHDDMTVANFILAHLLAGHLIVH